jgi:UDP-N-acetyl-D-glucosamine dehydrogenase
VIGGITPEGSEVGTVFLKEALETVIPVSSAEVAEMSKLLENTFRMINIGLVNELALMCDRLGVNVWEVIEAAATKPFGFMKFTPGPGLGGHCIPIDPIYLSWKLRSLQYHTRFIDLAAEINSNMPRFVIRQIQDALNHQELPLKGSEILVLGAAYKPDIDDLRESPALDVIDLLLEKGALVTFHDPHIPSIAHQGWELTRIDQLQEGVSSADCVVVITDHSAYDYLEIAEHANCIVDTRNALGTRGIQGEHIFPI